MKKLLVCIYICFGIPLFFTSISAAQQKIRIAYFNVPPFVHYDAEEKLVKGAVVDFLEQHMGPKMDVEFVWDKSHSPMARHYKSLENGSKDAVALMIHTPQRAEKFNFSATPYFSSPSAIAVLNSDKREKIEKVEDILPLRIGYGQHFFLTPFMRDKRINFDMVSSGNFIETNFKKLMLNRIDAVYTPDSAGLLAAMRRLDIENDVKLIKLPEKKSPFHVVFSKKMNLAAKRYNEVFDQIDGRKTFIKTLNKYIDISKL